MKDSTKDTEKKDLWVDVQKWNTAGTPVCSAIWELSNPYKKNDLFYQSICHPLRLLKIPQVAILGDLHCLKGSYFFFQILVHPHCPQKLTAKLRALTHPLNLSANRERL
jgi:hypothetical protein